MWLHGIVLDLILYKLPLRWLETPFVAGPWQDKETGWAAKSGSAVDGTFEQLQGDLNAALVLITSIL